jgi:hypothetical protein
LGQHLDGVGPAGRDENGRLAVGIREMRGDDDAALGVRRVGQSLSVTSSAPPRSASSGPSLHHGMTGFVLAHDVQASPLMPM